MPTADARARAKDPHVDVAGMAAHIPGGRSATGGGGGGVNGSALGTACVGVEELLEDVAVEVECMCPGRSGDSVWYFGFCSCCCCACCAFDLCCCACVGGGVDDGA